MKPSSSSFSQQQSILLKVWNFNYFVWISFCLWDSHDHVAFGVMVKHLSFPTWSVVYVSLKYICIYEFYSIYMCRSLFYLYQTCVLIIMLFMDHIFCCSMLYCIVVFSLLHKSCNEFYIVLVSLPLLVLTCFGCNICI